MDDRELPDGILKEKFQIKNKIQEQNKYLNRLPVEKMEGKRNINSNR